MAGVPGSLVGECLDRPLELILTFHDSMGWAVVDVSRRSGVAEPAGLGP